MLCDFYELTMGNGYFHSAAIRTASPTSTSFFRTVPDGGGFAIAAGLEQIVRYIQDLHFSEEDIAYLRGRGIFCEEFLAYLREFRFTGDIWAVPEGTPIFPREPIVTVRAPAVQAQLMETYLLLAHQPPEPDRDQGEPRRSARHRAAPCWSSARAGRRAATGAHLRRARGVHRRLRRARHAPSPTSSTAFPPAGTMAHSWVQMFDSAV